MKNRNTAEHFVQLINCSSGDRSAVNVSMTSLLKSSNDISIIDYIAKNEKHLRRAYLNWVNEFRCRYKKASILGWTFKLDQIDYYDLTCVTEKSIWKSQIDISIVVFALSDIIDELRPLQIEYIGNSKPIGKMLENLCKARKIDYKKSSGAFGHYFTNNQQHRKLGYPYIPESFKSLFQIISSTMQLLNYYYNSKRSPELKGSVTIYNPSFGLSYNDDSSVISVFWNSIPRVMRRQGVSINWLHYFVKNKSFKNSLELNDAVNKIERCDTPDSQSQLCNYLKLKHIYRIWRDYLLLLVSNCFITSGNHLFYSSYLACSLYPLHRFEWKRSVSGLDAIKNIVDYHLIDSSLCSIPKQNACFYLFENNNNEKMFCYLWKKYGHGKIIGVIHSTVRYWDLRYALDLPLKSNGISTDLLTPDLVAVNGPVAYDTLLGFGYPEDSIVRVEAQRYLYLYNNIVSSKKILNQIKQPKQDRNVIILGDYVGSDTEILIATIDAASKNISDNFVFTLKLHPNYPRIKGNPRYLQYSIDDSPLSDQLMNNDIAICSEKTSASVEAYLLGLNVIILLNESGINTSPLKDVQSVNFIKGPLGLTKSFLQYESSINNNNETKPDYFYLSPDCPRWINLIESVCK